MMRRFGQYIPFPNQAERQAPGSAESVDARYKSHHKSAGVARRDRQPGQDRFLFARCRSHAGAVSQAAHAGFRAAEDSENLSECR